MQSSIPEVTAIDGEPESTFQLYGEDARSPGTFAANCLLARRLAEKGVRFIQLYHPGWDQHGGLPGGIKKQCKETDRASYALVQDLKQRDMLKDTLVIWGGEFGRTNYCQGKFNEAILAEIIIRGIFPPGLPEVESNRALLAVLMIILTAWKKTEYMCMIFMPPFCRLGIDHERLTFKYQGRHFRLTDAWTEKSIVSC